MKIILAIIASIMALTIGCVYRPYHSTVSAPTNTVVASANGETVLSDQIPARDKTWISPGKINISNYYPGATAECWLTVHNGNYKAANFNIEYRDPSYTAEGYDKITTMAEDWVIIAGPSPVLEPYETRDILISLKVPSSLTNLPKKWEYWISVMDNSQSGTVITELCSRWLISMR